MLRKRGDYERAISDYTEAIRLDPKYSTAYANRGFAWLQKGDLDRAIGDYDRAIELSPKTASSHANRAVALSAQGR